MHTNRLVNEKSPYLLQHAHNPVDWLPWGDEAFEIARREDKPIFLSIGYSTCHWCHVMERESFENPQIAEILNRNFVPIKVDREERPDIDRIYMTFVQATTGSGGWPMSVWLTPDLRPFFGGTYFPPDNRYGRAGFPVILERVAEAWRDDREKILDSSRDIVEQLQKHVEVAPARPGSALEPDPAALESGFFAFRRSFDARYGGFGGAPKFPRPSVFHFLARYWARTRNQEALDMVLATLRAMTRGGMHDHLGGGFHRYSVDERWFVPHFEKMLYDQAQLAVSCLEAFQITGEMEYAEVARRTLDYVLREMTDAGGGFYSAEDADSAIDPARPEVKSEGAFYLWAQSEIEQLLGQPEARWFCYRYGVREGGNVESDPHGEFRGKNILYEAHTVAETAREFGRDEREVRAALLQAEGLLRNARAGRPRPHLDDKVLTGWNGLMVSALAKGGAILREPRYLEAARRAADFIAAQMYQPATGTLLRRYRQGEAAIAAFLDDYAFFVQGLLDLYEAGFDFSHLDLAVRLTETQMERFEDRVHGAFFSSAADDASAIMRVKEDYDGAEPSGNSIAALNLLRLAHITNREDFRESARRTLAAFGSRMTAGPIGVPHMLATLAFSLSSPKQVILVGDPDAPDTQALLQVLQARFVPNRVAVLVDSPPARERLSAWIPAMSGIERQEGRATAYVCENYTCRLPTADPEKFAELLQ